MKLSRRSLFAIAGAGAAIAQTQTAPPAAPAAPENSDPKVAAAREENRRSAQRLAAFEIPIETEPAIVFRP